VGRAHGLPCRWPASSNGFEEMDFDRYAGIASAVGLLLILLITIWLGLWGPVAHEMTWTDFGEFAKVLGSLATGGAAVTGAIVAWRGLEKWRAETVGKKKYELAAAVLTDFYEMNEIIRTSRGAFVLAQEIQEIAEKGIAEELAASYAPEQRLLKNQEFFARFRARKFEFAAYFGKTAAAHFDEIWKIRLEINWAVHVMLQQKEAGQSSRPEDIKLWKSWRAVAFADPREGMDPLVPRLNKIMADVEAICQPAIEDELELTDSGGK
jgi:hypothetical protein